MTLFGEILDADSAHSAGLVHRVVLGDQDDLVSAAVELASGAAAAPRDLLVTTKRTMDHTRTLDSHAEAVDVEIAPQVVSLRSQEFTDRLAAMKARIAASD